MREATRTQVRRAAKSEPKKKLRVATYCRVSTDSDEQETSFNTQVEVYEKRILGNPNWEYAGVYADEGLSGTSAAKRVEFQRMMEDCREGKIDRILTKSISRFARNTLDCIEYVRELKQLNVTILFEKEHIDTAGAYSEMMLTQRNSCIQGTKLSYRR